MTNPPTVSKVQRKKFGLAFVWSMSIGFLTLCAAEKFPSIYTYAQTPEKVRSLRSDFVAEDGCPVSVVNLRTELDIDPFNAPIDARIYVDYKNIGQKPIAAVKFRLRFVDDSGNNKGTFQAADGAVLQPGEQASQKFQENRIYPSVSSLMARVLTVKYLDGQIWQSEKAAATSQQ